MATERDNQLLPATDREVEVLASDEVLAGEDLAGPAADEELVVERGPQRVGDLGIGPLVHVVGQRAVHEDVVAALGLRQHRQAPGAVHELGAVVVLVHHLDDHAGGAGQRGVAVVRDGDLK